MIAKKFIQGVKALFARTAKDAVAVTAFAAHAVRAAYSDVAENGEHAQFLLDESPVFIRRALYTFFKRAGLNVTKLDRDIYTAQGPLDRSRQSKVFEWLQTDAAVLEVEYKERAEKAKKELVGTPENRAETALKKLIERMKGHDDLAAAVLNDIAARPHESCIYTADGTMISVSQDELNAVLDTLTIVRMTVAEQKKASKRARKDVGHPPEKAELKQAA